MAGQKLEGVTDIDAGDDGWVDIGDDFDSTRP